MSNQLNHKSISSIKNICLKEEKYNENYCFYISGDNLILCRDIINKTNNITININDFNYISLRLEDLGFDVFINSNIDNSYLSYKDYRNITENNKNKYYTIVINKILIYHSKNAAIILNKNGVMNVYIYKNKYTVLRSLEDIKNIVLEAKDI